MLFVFEEAFLVRSNLRPIDDDVPGEPPPPASPPPLSPSLLFFLLLLLLLLLGEEEDGEEDASGFLTIIIGSKSVFFCAFLVCSKTKGKKKRSIIERKNKNTYSTLSDRSLSLFRSLVLKIDFLSSSLFLSFDRAVLKHVSAETSTPLLSLYIFHL